MKLEPTTFTITRIHSERLKQIQIWGNSSDDKQGKEEIAKGAAAYALNDPSLWPTENPIWTPEGFKTAEQIGRVNQLIRAGAMIVAEIERLERHPHE